MNSDRHSGKLDKSSQISDTLPEKMSADKLTASPVEIQWHVGMPIYGCEAFLRSDSDEFGWIGGKDDQARLRCVLPYIIMKRPGIRMVRFRTGTIPVAGDLELQTEKSFLNSVVEYFRSTDVDIIVPSGNTAIFRIYPDGALAAPYGTFIKNLDRPEDALLSEIRKTYRQNIRKAVAAGVQIKSGPEYLDIAYELIAQTLQRSKVGFNSYHDFKRRVVSLGKYVKIFVAEHDGVIQGCMVSPFSEHTAYNCYSGSRPGPVLGAMHLLHWEAIRQFRAMGVKHFDFQGVRIDPAKGSKQEGILTYKQGFGGQLVQGYLWKYPLRRLKSVVYSVGVRVLMGGDFVDQEHNKLGCKVTTNGETAVG